MTALELSAKLFDLYNACSLDNLGYESCKHSVIIPELAALVADSRGLLSMREAGRSLEGRSINLVSAGRGPLSILLWSQMHGDEPTATLALMDVFMFLVRNADEPWVRRLLADATIHVIPMLNPDGAERFRRFTGAEVDMNRDARALATPEARILREAQRTFRPEFGFNLHDQGLSSVGNSPRASAISLLAPALDEERSLPLVRVKAMRLGALAARVLKQFIPDHIATYDDAYEPRAFGDNMQSWGTSTLLIESGHWAGDTEKRYIRKLNFVAILTALKALSDGTYQSVDLDEYTGLALNGKRMMDILIKGVELAGRGGWSVRADIGLQTMPQDGRTSEFGGESALYAVKEVGDLHNFGGLLTIDASARRINASAISVERAFRLSALRDLLQL